MGDTSNWEMENPASLSLALDSGEYSPKCKVMFGSDALASLSLSLSSPRLIESNHKVTRTLCGYNDLYPTGFGLDSKFKVHLD